MHVLLQPVVLQEAEGRLTTKARFETTLILSTTGTTSSAHIEGCRETDFPFLIDEQYEKGYGER